MPPAAAVVPTATLPATAIHAPCRCRKLVLASMTGPGERSQAGASGVPPSPRWATLRCCLDRLHDLVVAGAAAQVAHHPLAYIGFGGRRVTVQQRLGGHDLAWRAEAALEAAV